MISLAGLKAVSEPGMSRYEVRNTVNYKTKTVEARNEQDAITKAGVGRDNIVVMHLADYHKPTDNGWLDSREWDGPDIGMEDIRY